MSPFGRIGPSLNTQQFFVQSDGFTPYGKKEISNSHFIIKRLLRIYPVYYLSLLFGLLIYSLRSYYETGYIFANFSKFNFVDIILSLTGGYAFVGKWGGPFVATSWFVALIITMYILFPFLSCKINKRPFYSICVLLLISSFSRIILYRYGFLNRPLDWFPLCRIFEFSLGISLLLFYQKSYLNFINHQDF
jgi:peptidoglycan/LPS O-acetylase OafA/YrhL